MRYGTWFWKNGPGGTQAEGTDGTQMEPRASVKWKQVSSDGAVALFVLHWVDALRAAVDALTELTLPRWVDVPARLFNSARENNCAR